MLTWQAPRLAGRARPGGGGRQGDKRTCQPRALGWGRQRRMLRCHRQRRLQGAREGRRGGPGEQGPSSQAAGAGFHQRTWRVQRSKQGAEKENELHCVHPAEISSAQASQSAGRLAAFGHVFKPVGGARVRAAAGRRRRARTQVAHSQRRPPLSARAANCQASGRSQVARCIHNLPRWHLFASTCSLQATIPAEHPCGHPIFHPA